MAVLPGAPPRADPEHAKDAPFPAAQSSTATGVAKVHQLEEKQLIDEAFEA